MPRSDGAGARRRTRRLRAALAAALLAHPAPAAHAVLTVVESRVVVGSDDAEQETGSSSTSLTSGDLELVTDGLAVQVVGLRFAGLAIPRGTAIARAWVQFQVDEVGTDAAVLAIRAQASDDAPTFTSAANDVSSRPTTAASVDWSPPAWPTVDAAGADQQTPDLAAVVQEVVDRPGWSSGHALVLIVTGTGRRTAESYEGNAAPLLHLEYDAPPDPSPVVALSAPADHAMFAPGESVVFAGSASDPEEGSLTASLAWTSSRDGPIGAGGAFATTSLSTGVHTVTASVTDLDGHTGSASRQIEVASGYHVLVGAGDIASCASTGDELTAALLDATFGTVVPLGDNVYEDGTLAEFQTCYEPNWGRHRARTHPTSGNHEYQTEDAAGYFAYFGAAAGDPTRGYYSYDVGGWHVVVLNSECSKVGGCTRTSPQGMWLAADLAAHPTRCTLATVHRPRFSSGGNGDNPVIADLWQILYEAGADVVLSGHDHLYERFDPQDPSGRADPTGLRLFVVGTGGKHLSSIGPLKPNSVISNDETFGVLKLTLWPTGYDWRFLPVPGASFSDSGSAACVDAAPPNAPPTVEISEPSDGASFPAGSAVDFAATAMDPEDGDLAPFLSWTSDRDGPLGTGSLLALSELSVGDHVIRAQVQDAGGTLGFDQTTVTITTIGSVCGDGIPEAPEACDDGNTTPGDGCDASCQVETTDCTDGADNDGDGLLDLEDPGCSDALDLSELAPLVACDDGADNDGDGRIDFDPATYADPSTGVGDPGCGTSSRTTERPQCQDGIDNDPAEDPTGLIDFDGGQSIHGACTGGVCPPGVSDPDGDGVADADPQCVGTPWRRVESINWSCGFGFELALLLPLLWRRR